MKIDIHDNDNISDIEQLKSNKFSKFGLDEVLETLKSEKE